MYEAVFQIEAAGVTIKNIDFIQSTAAKKDDAFIYINASDATIENNTFTGIENSGLAGMITASTETAFTGIEISGNVFTNLKYGAYFNKVDEALVQNNTVTSTEYNAFNIAEGSASFIGNTLADIATADENNAFGLEYNSGICAQEDATIIVKDNTITMHDATNDQEIYIAADAI